MGRLVATKKRNCVIHSDLCCQKLSAGFSILREYSAGYTIHVFFLLFAAGGFACCSFFVFTCVFLTRFFDFFYKGKIDTKFLSKNHASETETRGHR